MIASHLFAHLASEEIVELSETFATAYLRRNSQKSVDEVRASEASCVDMKIEPNGDHACPRHASDKARAMTSDERVDYTAEHGVRPRCARCTETCDAPAGWSVLAKSAS